MIKVENVRTVNGKLVTDAELVFVRAERNEPFGRNWIHANNYNYYPIFISRTERIVNGDWYVTPNGHILQSLGEPNESAEDGYFKILALPEHFSPEQLQMIVDDKLKEGKWLLECGGYYVNPEWNPAYIELNPHVTIYARLQRIENKASEPTKEELRKEFVKSFWVSPNGNVAVTKVDKFVDWFYSKLSAQQQEIDRLKKELTTDIKRLAIDSTFKKTKKRWI